MRSAILSLFVSLLVHVLLAAGLVLCLRHAPLPERAATLDVARVDLSFAETEAEGSVAPPASRSDPPEKVPMPRRLESPREPVAVRPKVAEPTLRALPDPPPEAVTMDGARSKEPAPSVEPASTASAAPPPKAAAPRQAQVDAPARPVRDIRPDYPRRARLRGEQGTVALEISVAADGSVSEARVIASSGYADLDAAARKAARKARFTPAQSGGRPVASTARLALEFRLR